MFSNIRHCSQLKLALKGATGNAAFSGHSTAVLKVLTLHMMAQYEARVAKHATKIANETRTYNVVILACSVALLRDWWQWRLLFGIAVTRQCAGVWFSLGRGRRACR